MQDRGSHIFPLPVNKEKRGNSRFFSVFCFIFLGSFFYYFMIIILPPSSTPALFPYWLPVADIKY